jgi:hypothetical protein
MELSVNSGNAAQDSVSDDGGGPADVGFAPNLSRAAWMTSVYHESRNNAKFLHSAYDPRPTVALGFGTAAQSAYSIVGVDEGRPLAVGMGGPVERLMDYRRVKDEKGSDSDRRLVQ